MVAFRAGVVVLRASLDTRDDPAGLRAPEVRRTADMLRVALILALSITRRAGIMNGFFLPILLIRIHYRHELAYGLRRSTIILSVRRLCRVLAPKVGKPQGVLG